MTVITTRAVKGSALTFAEVDANFNNLKTDVETNQSAIASHTSNTSNPHAVTKSQVGLGNVVNGLQLQASNNLSDLTNTSTARTNLGLGNSATLNTGTTAGTVAVGNHNHDSAYAALTHNHNSAYQPIDSDLTAIAGLSGTVGSLRKTGANAWRLETAFLSVKDFGAVGDGTTDDTAAIVAAIAASSGMTLYFPSGTYKITSRITISNARTRLVLDRSAILKRFYNEASWGGLIHVATGRFHMTGGCIDGNKGSYSSGSNAGILLYQCNDGTIEGVEVYDCGSHGISIHGDNNGTEQGGFNHRVLNCVAYNNNGVGISQYRAKYCIISDNKVSSSGLEGITCDYVSQWNRITNNFIELSCQSGGVGGIGVDSSSNNIISNNVVTGTANSKSGITLQCETDTPGSTTDITDNNVISGNQCIWNGGYGVHLKTNRITYPSSIITTAGSFIVNHLYEIKTIGTTDFTLIGAASNTVGVFFIATGAGSGTGDAYKLNTSKENLVSSNVFMSNTLAPIRVDDFSDRNIIVGNKYDYSELPDIANSAFNTRTDAAVVAFSARNTVTRTDVTGDGTQYNLIFDTVDLNRGSCYNNSTGIFTCQVTGIYSFSANVRTTGGNLHDWMEVGIVVVGGLTKSNGVEYTDEPIQECGLSVSVVPLKKGDQVYAYVIVGGDTKTVDVADSNQTFFTGVLVG